MHVEVRYKVRITPHYICPPPLKQHPHCVLDILHFLLCIEKLLFIILAVQDFWCIVKFFLHPTLDLYGHLRL
ncbi:hypothetical protein B0H13DRAFT_2372038 [Mycena leptocephala]|nr:hypothetical protein B0H13DRAFT_2372038 [Mycena leptocephala]